MDQQTCKTETGAGPNDLTPLKLRTTHVRVNVTQHDLDRHRKQNNRTDRQGAICDAINRRLRDGYQATFDGLSVGVVRTKNADGSAAHVPGWVNGDDVYEEKPVDAAYDTPTRYYRVCEDVKPFFRGVSPRVQKLHKLNTAHRKTTPARLRISLPNMALKLAESETSLDATFDANA